MSKEGLSRFVEQVASSEALQALVADGLDIEALIKLGAEHGHEFTAEDLLESNELGQDQLASVVGGARRNKFPVLMKGRFNYSKGAGFKCPEVTVSDPCFVLISCSGMTGCPGQEEKEEKEED